MSESAAADNYPSDSEESDEDFCPDEPGSDVSEEESDDDVTGQDEENSQIKKKNSKLKINNREKIVNNETESKSIRTTRTTAAAADKKLIEKNELESDEEDEKERSDALWASFLTDTNTESTTATTTETKPRKSPTQRVQNVENKLNDDTRKSPANETVKLTEVLEFAGEEILITKEVPVDRNIQTNNTATNKVLLTSSTSKFSKLPVKRTSSSGGIGSILGQIGKKTKISVLEKSKLDWDGFKEKEGLKEELKTFNKGKDGYLERQDFLQRTDVRQFEIERSLRQTKRNN